MPMRYFEDALRRVQPFIRKTMAEASHPSEETERTVLSFADGARIEWRRLPGDSASSASGTA